MDLTHRSRSRPRIGSVRRSALTFCLLFGLGLAVGWDSLDYSWNWDDLHLIRDYRAAELWGALVGPWDPDGIETAGWRPLTTLFNGGTYVLFGDVQSAHRLFRLGLFAAALTLLTNLVVRLGAAFLFALIGSTFAMAAKNSYYHYVWISDGVHALQLLLSVLALAAALRYLEGGGLFALGATVVMALAALLAREDSFAMFPVLAGVALVVDAPFTAGGPEARTRWRRWAFLGSGLAVAFTAFWTLRTVFVPSAPQVAWDSSAVTRTGEMLYWTASVVGTQDAWKWGFVAVGVASAVASLWLPKPERRRAWFWLSATVLACAITSPGARPNLLIFPSTFYSFFVAEMLAACHRRGAAGTITVSLIVPLTVLGAVWASKLEQQSLHPLSAEQLYRDWQFVGGPIRNATIPLDRVHAIESRLRRLGLHDSSPDFASWEEDLRRRGRVGFRDDGDVFLPSREFLEHPFLDLDRTVSVALELGATREFPPISLDSDGSAIHGVAFDRFRQLARAAHAATAAGVPIPVRTRLREIETFGLVIVAYPLTCGERLVPAVALEVFSPRRVAPPRGELIRTRDGLAQRVSGFMGPERPLAGTFAITAFRSDDMVHITYADATCSGTDREVILPVRYEDAALAVHSPPPLPAGIKSPQPPVVIEAVIDPDGRAQRAEVTDGAEMLAPTALAAVREWRFEPARLNRTPVPSVALVVVRFR